MRLYELQIEDSIDEVYAISLVEEPAIQSDFVYLGKEVIKFAQINNEQRLLVGPVLIPDKKILRVDAEGEPYEVFFSKETVKKLAQNYLKQKYTDKTTIEHEKPIKGVHLVESWIKEGKLDKSNNYGLSLPEGSWVGIFSIDKSSEGEDIWNNYVKTGKVKGFSVESIVSHKLIKASETIIDKDVNDMNDEEAEIFLSSLRALIKRDKRFKDNKRVEMESYNDYPESAKNNACKVLRWRDEHGDEVQGMTQVGWTRANQLCKGENISEETIARMASFARHEQNAEVSEEFKSTPWKDKGYVAWLGWGGTSGINWAQSKLDSIRND